MLSRFHWEFIQPAKQTGLFRGAHMVRLMRLIIGIRAKYLEGSFTLQKNAGEVQRKKSLCTSPAFLSIVLQQPEVCFILPVFQAEPETAKKLLQSLIKLLPLPAAVFIMK